MAVVRWVHPVGLAAALCACGPSGGAETTETSESSSTRAGEEDTFVPPSDDTSTLTSGDTTTTSGGDGTSTSAGSTSTSTTTGGHDCPAGDDDDTGGLQSVCDPQPEAVVVDVDFDIEFRSGDGEIVLDAQCIVDALVQEEPARLRIELTCDESGDEVARAVVVSSDPAVVLPLAIADAVHLQAAEVVPIDYGGYECVALRDDEGTLVVGQYQTHCPAELADPATWLAPFALEYRTGVCEPEPYEPPPDCAFIQDPCPGQDERAAFEVELGDESTLVHDRTATTLADFDVRVSRAIRHYPIDADFCGPGPYDSGTIVIQRPAE